MAVAGWVYLFASILSLTLAMAHNHSGAAETYHVSEGHLFLLKCLIIDANSNVTWSRVGSHNLSLTPGVEVRNGLLWFLPVHTSHSGIYTCETRGKTASLRMTVQVSSGECPEASETVSISQGVTDGLPCKQTEIFSLDGKKEIRWMKECKQAQPLFVDEKGFIMLHAVKEEDAGKYTCLLDLSVDGRNYTAARSIQLTINNDTVTAEPQLVFPHDELVLVEVGGPVKLKCLALIGPSEDEDVSMYWTVGDVFAENYTGLKDSWQFYRDKGRVYGLSILFIPEVRPDFLNVPINCIVRNSVGQSVGVVKLQKADHTVVYCTVALYAAGPLLLLALASIFLYCKVDLVLSYRKLLRHFSKQQAPDGKLYDGYVSFLNPKTQSSAEIEKFALQILPEVLEQKHGYSLYIRGRDDCPGEAFHDAIAAAIRQCRRLIIILSPEATHPTDANKTESATCGNRIQLCYEHKVGLHDALTRNNPRAILVEIDGPVDYSRLPESLCYIKRKQGALKFRTCSTGRCSNRNFWKNLRYHMPTVPAGKCQIIV